MVDSTIEIIENLPVASFLDETAEKLAVTNSLEINTSLEGAKKAYNYSRIVRNLYTDVGVQINMPGKPSRMFDRNAKRLLKLNIGGSNGYELYPSKELYSVTSIRSNSSNEALSLSITTNINPKDVNRETSKQYFIENRDLAGKQILGNYLSALTVRFYQNADEKRSVKRRFRKKYLLFERCNPLNYNFIPVSDKRSINLNDRDFNFLKEKSECYSKAFKDCLCLKIISCELSLDDCFSMQTEYTKKLYEDGKLNIMRALHYNLEGIDIGVLAKDNGFKGAFKNIYLNIVLANLRACFSSAKEQHFSGNDRQLEGILYEYNHTAESRGWKKATKEKMLDMIKKIPPKRYKRYTRFNTF